MYKGSKSQVYGKSREGVIKFAGGQRQGSWTKLQGGAGVWGIVG